MECNVVEQNSQILLSYVYYRPGYTHKLLIENVIIKRKITKKPMANESFNLSMNLF